MTGASSVKRPARLRFSLALLLLLTTALGLFLGWSYRERQYVAEGILSLTKPRGELIPGQPTVFDAKAEDEERRLIQEVSSRQFLQRLASGSMVADLATIKSRQNPVEWLALALKVQCDPGSRLLEFRITGIHPEMVEECKILDEAMNMIVFSEEVRRREFFAAELAEARDQLTTAERAYVHNRKQLNAAIEVGDEDSQPLGSVGKVASAAAEAMQVVKNCHRRIAAIEAEESLDKQNAQSSGGFGTLIAQRAKVITDDD